MDAENSLGRFLRARRELLRPEDVGLPEQRRRRVPGLRREELALLASVSADYYIRLEQGRDQHPSEQVLDALARALRLDDEATTHLHKLARPAPRRRRAAARPERVRPELQRLLDTWTQTPAFVRGRRMDVLAHNALAGALSHGFTTGTNLLRVIFLDPAAHQFYTNWDHVARDAVAALRASAGADLDDPQLTELVGELSLKSEAFRQLWARHDIREKSTGTKHFHHPLLGELTLDYQSFAINGEPGQLLIVCHAQPNSPAQHALALLSSIVAHDAPTAEPTISSQPDHNHSRKAHKLRAVGTGNIGPATPA
jgi:transcriptional regulator with XRE-family HTH domain